MTIRNSDELKKKLKVGLPLLSGLIGFIFVFLSVVIFWNGSVDYRTSQEQKAWAITTATVNYVEEKTKHSMSPGHYGHTFKFYDIHYEYVIDGQTYNGIIENVNYTKNAGDSLNIKYNPKLPEKSTYVIEPSNSFIKNGTILGGIGLILFVISFKLNKKTKGIK